MTITFILKKINLDYNKFKLVEVSQLRTYLVHFHFYLDKCHHYL